MARKKSNALAKPAKSLVGDFALMKADPSEIAALIRSNIPGGQMTQFDLPDRITVPTGGATEWQIQTAKGPTSVKELVGVVLHQEMKRAFWKQGLADGGVAGPPDCSSPDGVHGDGDPGGYCEGLLNEKTGALVQPKCPFAEFGSAKTKRGQACRSSHVLFMMRAESILPMVISLAPKSHSGKNGSRLYFLRLLGEWVPSFGVLTKIRLESEMGPAGPYSKAVCESAGELSAEERLHFQEIGEQLKSMIARVSASDVVDARSDGE